MVAAQMLSVGAALALAVPATARSAPNSLRTRSFEFPAAVPIAKRQVSGEQYQCHSDCGNTILESEDNDDYCDDDEWADLLANCLSCVEEFPIWQWYRDGVQGAAEGCGLTAEPDSPAQPDDDDDAEEEEDSSETTGSSEATSTAAEEEEPGETASETPEDDGDEEEESSENVDENEDEDEDEDEEVSDHVPAPSASESVIIPSGNETRPDEPEATEDSDEDVEAGGAIHFAGASTALGVGAMVAALFLA